MRPASKEPRPERRKDRGGTRDTRARDTGAEREREYDKTLADSFPASDPPATPNIIGPGGEPEPSSGKRDEKQP